MDQKTKNIIIAIAVVVGGAFALKFVFRFWWMLLIGGGCFVAGYLTAIYQRRKKKSK